MSTSRNRSLTPGYYFTPEALSLLIPNLLAALVHTAPRARLLPGRLIFDSAGS
jgi:hypothetical protein